MRFGGREYGRGVGVGVGVVVEEQPQVGRRRERRGEERVEVGGREQVRE